VNNPSGPAARAQIAEIDTRLGATRLPQK
jgi:hypothetical protein